MKRFLLTIVFFSIVIINTSGQSHFEKVLSVNFPNGVENQCAYIQFPSIPLWGWIEVTITSTWANQNSTGKITKRYEIGHNPGGHFHQKTEVPVVFGDISTQWFIGDFDNANNRIPLYHIVSTGNSINVLVEGLIYPVAGIENISNNMTINGPVTAATTNTRHYTSIIQDRLGIGTTTPTSLLHLYKDGHSYATIQTANNAYQTGLTLYKPSVFYHMYLPENTQQMRFYNNGAGDVMTLTVDGKVGIGTTNPQNKLDVAGTIRCTEVKVVALPWADFVFHPTYKLRTLGEVEQFIKANNHLPEIPTESEVKQNGIGLGEMNAKLLQKIEELTLYMIQKDKESKLQAEQLRQQDENIKLMQEELEKLKNSNTNTNN